MITCVIIDDEPLAIDVIKRYVEMTPGLVLQATYLDPREGVASLLNKPCDLLFLDIQMPELTGIELMRSMVQKPAVVITTAYREFAVEGFELDVLDYLVKPISYERFLKSIFRFREKSSTAVITESADHVFLKVEKDMVRIKFEEIFFVEALKNYSRIKTRTQEFIVYYTLGHLLDKLPSAKFKRIHKSYIINFDLVEKYNSASCTINNFTIPVGKAYHENLLGLITGVDRIA